MSRRGLKEMADGLVTSARIFREPGLPLCFRWVCDSFNCNGTAESSVLKYLMEESELLSQIGTPLHAFEAGRLL